MKAIIKTSIWGFATGLCLLFSSTVKANETPKKTILVNSISDIKKHIATNQLTFSKNNETVKVVFTVNDFGAVDLVIANTTNQTIKHELEKQFSNMVFENLKTNHTYGIQINFKTI